MKNKVLISIVGIALFAMAVGFGSQENNRSETVESNIAALQNAEAKASCLSCSYAEGSLCYISGQTTDDYYCYQAYDHERDEKFITQ
ncbi:MAG: hypothetical protein ACQESQ_12615 [Bacteroidota bacterium]